MWYVIQVINGREDVMRERIERMVPAGAMQELFYPQYQTEIKVHGEWVNTTKPLFPGYLICDTADPRTVQQYLLRMDDFARVLSQDGQFVPLAKEEVQLIGGFTHKGDRVVPMSEALKDGDQVVVTAGPLLGHEGLIKTINRRKSTAYLELDLCGRRVTTRVGLAVLSAERRQARAGADHPARGRFLRSAHLPHARHGLQQRATYLPTRNLVDQAIKGGLAGGLSAALIAVARFAPANLKSEAKSSW